jgi:hypothetical protein
MRRGGTVVPMSFVTCDPDVLLSADAGEVCALTATQVLAHATRYQPTDAQAAAIHEMFVSTLRASGHLYAATEAARAVAAG